MPTAEEGIKEVKAYLALSFSQKKVDKLDTLISAFEAEGQELPDTYPVYYLRPRVIRKAVIHHRLIFLYFIVGDEIIVSDAWDTRQDR